MHQFDGLFLAGRLVRPKRRAAADSIRRKQDGHCSTKKFPCQQKPQAKVTEIKGFDGLIRS